MGPKRFPFRAMGAPCQLQLVDAPEVERIARAAIDEVARLERKYSRYRDDSVASEINRSAGHADGVPVDAETAALLDYAAIGHRESGGRFDVTSGVLRRAWDFRAGRLPSEAEIAPLRELVGWQRVRWDGERIGLPIAGMEIDFGGYVKEYTADRVAALCREMGADSGVVDLGGDIAVIGPNPDGSPWRIGVRHPRVPGVALAWIPLASGAIATSGDYERFMVVDGRRYGHILDPATGWPVEGLVSVSVVAPHCVVAGTATTIAMLMPEDEGREWLRGLALPHLYVDRRGDCGGSLSTPSRTGSNHAVPRPEPGIEEVVRSVAGEFVHR